MLQLGFRGGPSNQAESIADSLSFRDAHDAAYHAHKHSVDMQTMPPREQEMVLYVKEARETIKNGIADSARPAQLSDGSSVMYTTPNGAKCIVFVDGSGNAAIATYMPVKNQAKTR